ncbi:MAG: PLP-dependent aminotransferase family protein [Alphaproteobacteria bacterium]|jgi:2-aminoadipate transaminase|nr:PLP-dependent aminotransferase family protein [Alphaproteobacteria bacterium]
MTFEFRKDSPAAVAPWAGYPAYNFIGGHNDAAGIPAEHLAQAASRALARDGHILATYNMGQGPQGYLPLREVIARILRKNTAMTCEADEILVTSGSLQAIDLVNAVMIEPGDTAIVEASTYAGALSRLRSRGADWVGVEVDEDGMRADELERALAAMKSRGVRPKYIYTIPTVQNPTGTVMSVERRHEILGLAAKYDVPIFEDDCYADLMWGERRPPAIRALDDSGRVMYCGSFSKSLAPALRLGYLVADWPLLSRVIPAKADGGTGAIDQLAIADYAAEHFETHLVDLRQTLKAKCDAMVEALEAHFGVRAEFEVPRGGIFIWVTLPEAVDTTKLAAAALEEGVAVNPGADWSADPETGRHRIRLCFGNPTIESIKEGVARLAEICRRETGIPERSANLQQG